MEAVLFAHGEAISLRKLGNIVKLGEEELKEALLALQEGLNGGNRGLMLVSEEPIPKIFEGKNWGAKKVQLGTKSEFAPLLREFLKEEMGEELTPASLEVLSIIAYLGPVSRAKIEYVRGVNSAFTLRNLLMRGLVERIPNEERGNAFVYKPSMEFLRHLGVSSPEGLEEYQKFQELKKDEI